MFSDERRPSKFHFVTYYIIREKLGRAAALQGNRAMMWHREVGVRKSIHRTKPVRWLEQRVNGTITLICPWTRKMKTLSSLENFIYFETP